MERQRTASDAENAKDSARSIWKSGICWKMSQGCLRNNWKEDSYEYDRSRKITLGLRAAGWTEKEMNDLILYIESGEEQYKPKPKKEGQNKQGTLVHWLTASALVFSKVFLQALPRRDYVR